MFGLFDDETGGHGGDLREAVRRWKPRGGKLLDFSSNVNPLGPPPGLVEYLKQCLPEIANYPSPHARELREQLAAYLGLPARKLLVGNGASELIHLLIMWKRPRKVYVPAPTFSEYERAAALAGAEVNYYPLPPGKDIFPSRLAGKLQEKDLVVICNPNNPTGKLIPKESLLAFIEAAKKRGAAVMIDESFIPLTGKPEESLIAARGLKVWVIMSLTKLWALPGLRLGCLVGPGRDVEMLIRRGDPWRVNILAQAAGIYCLGQAGYLEEALALIKRERAFLGRQLEETGYFRVYKGAANFLLVKGTDPGFRVADFQADLAGRGVLIRRADNFFGLDHRYFRIAVLRHLYNLRLIEETTDYLRNFRAARESSGTGDGSETAPRPERAGGGRA